MSLLFRFVIADWYNGVSVQGAGEGEAGVSDKAWGTPRENDHNGRHELHDVNAPPTARRAGLNLILIKSNKSADEWFLPGPGPVGPIPVAPLAPGPLGRVSAELSRTVSFSDFATREMQLKRDQRELSEKLVSTSVYAAFWLMTRWKKDWPRHGTRVLISFSFAVVVYLQALIKSPAPSLSLSLSSPSVFTFSPFRINSYFVLLITSMAPLFGLENKPSFFEYGQEFKPRSRKNEIVKFGGIVKKKTWGKVSLHGFSTIREYHGSLL